MHAVQLVLVVVFAIAGYQEANRFGRQTGRTPWGWPALAWAVVLGLSFIIGLVLIAIAERQGRARARNTVAYVPSDYPPSAPIGVYSPDATNYSAPPPFSAPPRDATGFPPSPPIGEYAATTTILPNP